MVGSPAFTPRAKKVLELGLREALQLGHNYVGPEHLLFGLLTEGQGVGCQVLAVLGLELPSLRERVIEVMSGYQPTGTDPRPAAGPSAGSAAGQGPRCGRCGADLADTARYHRLDVPPADPDTDTDPLPLIVVSCDRCGTTLAMTITSPPP